MSAILLQVRGGKVICRDRESDSPYDTFRLAGAVIVDGKPHMFVLPTVASNETIQTSLAGYTLFPPREDGAWVDGVGGSGSTTIGLVLRAYDVDDNDEWHEDRDEIERLNGMLADTVENIPKYGEAAAALLRAWPKVVDQFVKWDKNDLLLSAALAIDLPPPSPFPGVPPRYYWVSVRGTGDGLLTSWDYEVFVHFTYSSGVGVSFPPDTLKVTYTPLDLTVREEWLGTWAAVSTTNVETSTTPSVTATIRPSTRGDGFDVAVTETGGRTIEYANVPAPPAGAAPVVAKPISPDAVDGNPVAEASKEPGLIFVPDPDLPPAPPDEPESVTGADPHNSPVVVATEKGSGHATGIGDADLGQPVRQFGDGVLELGPNAVLQMHSIEEDGHPTEGRALRYLRPVSGTHIPTAPHEGAADAMLVRKST
jgi:hypothetical protein